MRTIYKFKPNKEKLFFYRLKLKSDKINIKKIKLF